MARQKGMIGYRRVALVILGVVVFLFIVSILAAYFFGAGFGCFSSSDCRTASQELNRLIADMNKVCERGALSGDEPIELGTYNFPGADYFAVDSGNSVRVAQTNIANSPSEWSIGGVIDGGLDTEDRGTKWMVEKQAKSCDDVLICDNLQTCIQGQTRDALGVGGFWLGRNGEFTITSWTPSDANNIHIGLEQSGSSQ